MGPEVGLRCAWCCLLVDPDAYRRVARDRYLTGPALLVALVGITGSSVLQADELNPLLVLGSIVVWFVGALVIFATGHLLSRRGSFTQTLRGLAFARVVTVFELFSLVPAIESAVHTLTLIMLLIATWLAAAVAHDLKGWRAAVLPVTLVFVYLIGGILVYSLVKGFDDTLQMLQQVFKMV